ncbi:helix-turn-helix domain-containing protein [Flavobacterium branchiophilum]|uniref:helix-turn-helix domain-containing protein n=1 Tax=Flavobacterium branchiophilum TaxID=55197 RepID=UPI001CBFBE44|nr:helix-turn-helix transcriptional regulator [Flavobacterium branchiophilum]
MHHSNYSKIKNGQRELSIDALKKIVKYFGIATDQFINYENGIPTEVTTENKTLLVQVKLIQILEPEEKKYGF